MHGQTTRAARTRRALNGSTAHEFFAEAMARTPTRGPPCDILSILSSQIWPASGLDGRSTTAALKIHASRERKGARARQIQIRSYTNRQIVRIRNTEYPSTSSIDVTQVAAPQPRESRDSVGPNLRSKIARLEMDQPWSGLLADADWSRNQPIGRPHRCTSDEAGTVDRLCFFCRPRGP